MTQYAADFLPFRASNAVGQPFAGPPTDWTSPNPITVIADGAARRLQVVNATWTPPSNDAANADAEWLVRARGSGATVTLRGLYQAIVNVVGGTITIANNFGAIGAAVSLPAGVWTSSASFRDYWLRFQVSGTNLRARVWSVTEAEPASWTIVRTDSSVSGAGAVKLQEGTVDFAAVGTGADVAPAPRAASDAGYYDAWFKEQALQSAPRMMIADVFVPGRNANGDLLAYTEAVLRAAMGRYDAGPVQPMAGVIYPDALLEVSPIRRALPVDLYGRADMGDFTLVIDNTNGARDDWLRAKMQKSFVRVRFGDPAWAWFDFKTLVTGTVDDVAEANGRILVKAKSGAARFDRSFAMSVLGGATANAGRPVPRVLGRTVAAYNVEPPLEDATALLYRVSVNDCQSVVTVRDNGDVLQRPATTITQVNGTTDEIETATPHGRAVNDPVAAYWRFIGVSTLPPADFYYVKSVTGANTLTLSETLGGPTFDIGGAGWQAVVQSEFRYERWSFGPGARMPGRRHLQMRVNPVGKITADVIGEPSTTASVLLDPAITLASGETTATIDRAVGGINLPDVSVVLQEPVNRADVLDRLFISKAAAWGATRAGWLTAYPLSRFGAAISTVAEGDLWRPEGSSDYPFKLVSKERPIAHYEGARVGYATNWSPHTDGEIAGAVTAANRARLKGDQLIWARNAGGSGNLSGLDSGDKGETRALPLVPTYLTDATAAAALGNSWPLASGKQRAIIEADVVWDALDKFELGRWVNITVPRYGISAAPRNVALSSLGASAIASSTFPSPAYAASLAIDGSRSSEFFWNDDTPAAWPDWLVIDLPAPYLVDRLTVVSPRDALVGEPAEGETFSLYGLTDFSLSYWSGSEWLAVPGAAVTGNNLVIRHLMVDPPIVTDRVRLNVTDALASYSRVCAVEARAMGQCAMVQSIEEDARLGKARLRLVTDLPGYYPVTS